MSQEQPSAPRIISADQQADAGAAAAAVLDAAAARSAMPAAQRTGLAVVVTAGDDAHSQAALAAAEAATAAQATELLQAIEQEVLVEIEAIIGRADAPQLGDEAALRDLHAMLAKARSHVEGPLAMAKVQAAARLAVAQTLPLPAPTGDTPSPRSADEAALQRRLMSRRLGHVCRAWRAHCRRSARARRAVERIRCARLGSAWCGLREGTRLLAAERQEETYRAAVAELQSRMAEQDREAVAERAARAELLTKLAAVEAETQAAAARQAVASPDNVVGHADYRSSPVVLAVSADEAAQMDRARTSPATTPRIGRGSADPWADAMRLDHSALRCVTPGQPSRTASAPQSVSKFSQPEWPHDDGNASASQLVLGMIELIGYRIREPEVRFARPHLIYEFQVSVGSEIWQGEKRFTDFQHLYDAIAEILSDGKSNSNVLETRNISLPAKRWVGNLTSEVGDERIQILQHYMSQLGHLASPAAAESGELPDEISQSIHAALVSFVRDRHEVTAAEFVVAAAAAYFEQVEKLREAFAECDTAGTGRLTDQDLERFLRDGNVKLAGSEGREAVADELRELREAGKIHRLKHNLAAEGISEAGAASSGLTLGEMESWWSQRCLRTQSASAAAPALG